MLGVLVIVKTANWWLKSLNPLSNTIAPPMSRMLLGTHKRGEVDIGASSSGNPLPLLEVIDDIIIGWSHAHRFTHWLLEQQLYMVDVTEYDSLLDKAARRLPDILQREAQLAKRNDTLQVGD
jgi:hypothetical protein